VIWRHIEHQRTIKKQMTKCLSVQERAELDVEVAQIKDAGHDKEAQRV